MRACACMCMCNLEMWMAGKVWEGEREIYGTLNLFKRSMVAMSLTIHLSNVKCQNGPSHIMTN